ncbi:TIGR04255 family protein [Ekhidna sp. To15]|uniref:TIGR04255 family protein n=1 Tax=Ekhidna sp. To15 TaxID=3395267 RepID=UPI003F527CB2
MKTTKKFKNPPLTEAVFELFYQTSNWNPATPGTYYSKVSKDYPVITQSGGGFGIALGAQGVQIGSGNNNLTQFKSQDNSSIIQLSNNLFTVNKLPKYGGWESYKEMILEAVELLYSTIDIQQINRIGLRAINKLDVKSHSLENFKRSFNVYPNMPNGIVNDFNSLQLNYETSFPDNEVLAVNFATLRKESGYEAPVQFQLYYTKLTPVDKNSIEKWLDNAHMQLHSAFDHIVTSEQKKEFDND